MSFKTKPTKKVRTNNKNSITLDVKHKEYVTEFFKDETDKIPKLKKEKKFLTELLKKHNCTLYDVDFVSNADVDDNNSDKNADVDVHVANTVDMVNTVDTVVTMVEDNNNQFDNDNYDNYTNHTVEFDSRLSLEQVLNYQDRIKEITREIRRLKSKKNDYYLNNSKYIFDYFENKKNISNGIVDNTKKSNLIEKFFKINTTDTDNEMKNNNLFQKYLNNVDEWYIDMNSFIFPNDICSFCKKGELVPLDDEGILLCKLCSKSVKYLIENEKPSYKEPPKEVCFYAYKKINHFKEILAQFQGKETTQIPPDLIDKLKLQIKKERIDIKKLTYLETKMLLKKIGFSKYYEHINFIKHKLGIKPPIITQALEEILCNLFIEIQYPYSKYCPDYRTNFLHYYYVLYKLFELLGETHFLLEIPMLKDKEKLIEQDNIWKKICQDKGWEFNITNIDFPNL
jgi:hypothetical protein